MSKISGRNSGSPPDRTNTGLATSAISIDQIEGAPRVQLGRAELALRHRAAMPAA